MQDKLYAVLFLADSYKFIKPPFRANSPINQGVKNKHKSCETRIIANVSLIYAYYNTLLYLQRSFNIGMS